MVNPGYIISEGMPELKDLLERAKEDENAFREIYEFTIDRVFQYVFLRVKDRSLAKDVVQEIYISLWKSIPKFSFRSEEEFQGFLWKIVKRRIIKSRKKIRGSVSIEEIYDIPYEQDFNEDYRFLLKAVSLLKERMRLVVELRYFGGQSFRDVAQTLGISESNAKVLHHRAIKILEQNFKNV